MSNIIEVVGVLIGLVVVLVASSPRLVAYTHPRIQQPPPKVHISYHPACLNLPHIVNDSSINCHGARFHATNGIFLPCNRHSHCYDAREPTDWCILGVDYKWVHAGCHCDKKLGTCLIERYNKRLEQLEWGYCTPVREFFCASHVYYPN